MLFCSGMITFLRSFKKLAPIAENLTSAPASLAYVERVFSVCGDLTAGKRNRHRILERRVFLTVNAMQPTSKAASLKGSMVEEYDQPIFGTCQLLCPTHEAQLRKSNGLVHYLEMVPSEIRNPRSKNQISCLVKEFQRPAAGKAEIKPCDLRPAQVLLKTVHYLFNSIVPRADIQWCRVYDFVFNRLRAVRQDMVIQRINDSLAVHILEMNIRFHVFAGYKLCAETLDNFDPEINRSHTLECLKRLLVLYSNRQLCSCHIGEFLAFYLLCNLGSEDVFLLALELKQHADSSPVFNLSLALTRAFHCGNFIRVLKLASKLPVLHLCALYQHLTSVRCGLLRVLSAGAGGRGQSVSQGVVARWLACDINCLVSICSACGLATDDGNSVVIARPKYQDPVRPVLHRCNDIDGQLMSESIPDLLIGRLCEIHCRSPSKTSNAG